MLTRALLAMVAVYRAAISPLLGPNCRYAPSCSHYMEQALRAHGAGRGAWLGVRRILRCHPWAPGGYDPVPPAPARAVKTPSPLLR